MNNKLLVGTAKGLVVLEKCNLKWEISTIHFLGFPVSMIFVDANTGHWWVALDHRHWGCKLHQTANQGVSWEEIEVPSYDQRILRKDKKAFLKKIWVMESAGANKPGCFWLGTEPGGLFYTEDYGKSFQLNTALWDHPSRKNENEWFGAGRDFPFIHSIIVDPRDSDHVYVAISSAGVFETNDGGKSWKAKNNGLIATYLPDPAVEIGHDPHSMLCVKESPDFMWQQNHCGIFKSENGGGDWQLVSKEGKVPHYGFALAIDEKDPLQAWVIPVQSDEQRVAADLKLAVYHTNNAGVSWQIQELNTNSSSTFDIVLRQGFAKDGAFLVFGTNSGNLYFSKNYGETWESLSNNLASIGCIKIV